MFHVLRKHRRLGSVAIVAALTVWLSAVLTSCLLAPAQPMPQSTAAAVESEAASASDDMGPCPGGVCATLQSDRDLAADHHAAPSTPKLLLVALFLAAVLFAVVRPRRDGPRPADPLLPKRSPLLRFYALRI